MAILKYTDIKDNEYIYKSPDFTSQDFIDGKIDVMSGYITDQPYLFRELGIKVNIINPLNYGIDFYGDNLFTTQKDDTSDTLISRADKALYNAKNSGRNKVVAQD